MRPVLFAASLIVAAVTVAHSQAPRHLYICHAGSVSAAFVEVERAFRAEHAGVEVSDVSGGSVALARRFAAGQQPCDIYAPADYLDIDHLLKPAGLADYTIIFARGRMVLAYLATDPVANGIATKGNFRPPSSVPDAAADWYQKLVAPGVRIGGAHPFVDPAGYRSHMIFDLMQRHYGRPGLYNGLLEHYVTVVPSTTPGLAGQELGRDYNFQFIYEHSAEAAARLNSAYRYVYLPNAVDLSSERAGTYARASITLPGLGTPSAAPSVTIPASAVAWGITITTMNADSQDALAFLELLLGPIGAEALHSNGPSPLTPARVRADDVRRLPSKLRTLVKAQPIIR